MAIYSINFSLEGKLKVEANSKYEAEKLVEDYIEDNHIDAIEERLDTVLRIEIFDFMTHEEDE